MKLKRSGNAKRNVIAGVFSKAVTILLPFITQTVFIKMLGAEYNGLRGMFTSILQVLSLAELGFSSALVFSMYEPIANDDHEQICALLNLYKKLYKITGSIVFCAGLLVMPFLEKFIKGTYPSDINISIVYFIYLMNTVLSYWFFAYKVSLLNAFQRLDIISIVSLTAAAGTGILQIISLVCFRSFYIYLITLLLNTITNNLLTARFVDKMYPQYKCYGKVPAQTMASIKKKTMGLAMARVCGVTRNSFDNIFLSMFIGLAVTGIYNNYYHILMSVTGFMSIISSSLLAGVGNSIASETVQKNYEDMKKLDFIFMVISGWCSVCLVCLYQTFMELWLGKDYMFPSETAVLFSVYFYILCMGQIRAVYADGAGLWWENRYRIILEAVSNIILNYLFVQKWGVNGIILATAVSLFLFGFICSAIVTFKYYFRQGTAVYFKSQFYYALVTAVNGMAVTGICGLFQGSIFKEFVVRVMICCTVSPLLFYLAYFKTEIYNQTKHWFAVRIKIRGR